MSYAEAQYTVDEVLAGVKKSLSTGVPPNNVKFKLYNRNNGFGITFDAQDTVIEGQTICTIGGAIIRRKLGSMPVDENDGILVGEFTREQLNAHKVTPFEVTGLTNGEIWYVKIFTYSDHGVFNYSNENGQDIYIGPCVYGFHQDFTQSTPANQITYIGVNANYTPMMTNSGAGAVTLGSWGNWDWLKRVLPYMVKPTGIADYQLNPDDYTKKLDGSPSDVNNEAYDGSAFVWLPRMYMREVYASDGQSRDVYFTEDPSLTGVASSYAAVGFQDTTGDDLKGVWIPMFYSSLVSTGESTYKYASFGNSYIHTGGLTQSKEKQYIDAFSSRARFLGGSLMNFLRDILFLLYKTTNITAAAGKGYPVNGGVSNNYIVNNGAFYGTNDGKSLNKIFHSVILGSYLMPLRDPYTMISGTNASGAPLKQSYNYLYDSDGSSLASIGVWYQTSKSLSVYYPRRLGAYSKNLGSNMIRPDANEGSGSSNSYICGVMRYKYTTTSTSGVYYSMVRFRYNSNSGWNILSQCEGPTTTDTQAVSYLGVGLLLLPQSGYIPE